MSTKAIFLDRDGTINVEVNYLHEPEKFRFLPTVQDALKLLQKLEFKLIIITNQAGIAKGIYSVNDMEQTNAYMKDQLKLAGITIDAIYFCPHRTEDQCNCRKPLPGMIFQAAKDLNIDLTKSWTIGDKLSDIEAGVRATTKTILVQTGYGEEEITNLGKITDMKIRKNETPHFVAINLWHAAQIIQKSL